MRTLLTVMGLFAGSILLGQMGPIESLVERSPFLPPGYRAEQQPTPQQRPAAPVPPASTRYELVGVVANNGEVSVSLRPRGGPRGVWLAPGESLDDVRFIRFNLATREAMVETGGRRETIPLKTPTVTGQVPQPAPPTVNPNRIQPQVTTAAPANNPETVKIPVRRRVIVPQQ